LSKSSTIKSLIVLVEKQAAQMSTVMLQMETMEALAVKREAYIESLERELAIYKNRKNSGNSHIPPSVDLAKPKRNQSLREKSDKKAGGQQGHEGSTLTCSATPDLIITHIPEHCGLCGNDLSPIEAISLTSRQVIDIPIPVPVCTEHQTFAKTCTCGHINKGEFPVNVKAKVQYGSHIEALTAYLNVRQYMPYNRIQEFYSQLMGLNISQGGIGCLLERFTGKALPSYQEIKNRVEKAVCLGTDETGAKVDGKKHWFWTWQNEELTFIIQSPSRGYKTIGETFPLGLPNAVLVHDRWAPHFNCPAYGHQICLAHLFRDLNYIQQTHQSRWAESLKLLLKEAIVLNKDKDYDGSSASPARDKLEQSLIELLQLQLPEKDNLAITLQKKLRKISHYILFFLHNNHVPPDNNGSEGAIRTLKVKQKVSGGFRSTEGADGFAVIRSIIDTTIKSGKDVFNALSLITTFGTG
jgi:transposase